MPKKILITGGRGFIGSKLTEALTKLGDDCETFDMVNGQDLRNPGQVAEFVRGKKCVFHLAAVADLNWARAHPEETMDINVKGTWNVALACHEYKARLYYASTCCVFGHQNNHPTDETALPNPAEIYACSKLAGEDVIKGFHHTYGLEYNFMRFATIYGEGTRPALGTHIFFGQALRGEPITVHGKGTQTRTLTHVDDLVSAIVALYKSDKVNDVWNMSNTEEISAFKMAVDIKVLTGSNSPIKFIPQRIGQTMKEIISVDKIKREIGWEPQITWQEGLERMYKWYLDTGQVHNHYKMPV